MSDAAPDTAPVTVAVRDGAAYLTLNRPEKRNALDAETVTELKTALRGMDGRADVRVIALAGAGKDFCAGADLSALRRIAEGSAMENLRDVDELRELFLLPRTLAKPVVALVRGRALAGGCGLALACDLVLAGEDARFGFPEVKIGFVPAMVMAILRRNVGEKRAFDLVATGREIGAAEAERFGVANRVFAEAEFDAGCAALLQELAARSASAVQLTKRLLYHADGMSFEAALRAGADLNVVARMTDDMRAGVERFLAGARS